MGRAAVPRVAFLLAPRKKQLLGDVDTWRVESGAMQKKRTAWFLHIRVTWLAAKLENQIPKMWCLGIKSETLPVLSVTLPWFSLMDSYDRTIDPYGQIQVLISHPFHMCNLCFFLFSFRDKQRREDSCWSKPYCMPSLSLLDVMWSQIKSSQTWNFYFFIHWTCNCGVPTQLNVLAKLHD